MISLRHTVVNKGKVPLIVEGCRRGINSRRRHVSEFSQAGHLAQRNGRACRRMYRPGPGAVGYYRTQSVDDGQPDRHSSGRIPRATGRCSATNFANRRPGPGAVHTGELGPACRGHRWIASQLLRHRRH